MSDVKAILIPLDGSDLAECALAAGSSIARRLNAFIHLVRVHTQLPLFEVGAEIVTLTPESEREITEQEEQYLEGVATQLRAEGLAVSTTVVKGSIVPALHSYTEHHGIGLVVMSSHGRGGIRRAVLGSVADQLVRSVSIPVLIVTPAMAPRIDDQWPRRVLVPLDGSELGDSAIDAVRELDPRRTAQLLLATILQTSFPPMSPWAYQPDLYPEAVEHNQERLRMHLNNVADGLRADGFRVAARILNGGKVAREILKLGIARQCDMIVMATHGAGGLDRVMFGSVADQVIRHSNMPILVVRPMLNEPTQADNRREPAFVEAGA